MTASAKHASVSLRWVSADPPAGVVAGHDHEAGLTGSSDPVRRRPSPDCHLPQLADQAPSDPVSLRRAGSMSESGKAPGLDRDTPPVVAPPPLVPPESVAPAAGLAVVFLVRCRCACRPLILTRDPMFLRLRPNGIPRGCPTCVAHRRVKAATGFSSQCPGNARTRRYTARPLTGTVCAPWPGPPVRHGGGRGAGTGPPGRRRRARRALPAAEPGWRGDAMRRLLSVTWPLSHLGAARLPAQLRARPTPVPDA